jgi:hypothetical protein
MSTKVLLFSVFIGVVVAGGGYFLLNNRGIPNTRSSTPIQSDWKTYGNTAFKYRVQYPSNMSVGPLDQYNYITPITEQNQIIITKDDLTPNSYNNLSYVAIKIAAVRYLGAPGENPISQNLRSFAEAKQASLLNGVSPTIKAQVSDLQKMDFASSTAYFFDISDDFELATAGSGYPPPGIFNRYIFFENQNKEKFIIWYPKDDSTSQKIVDTFRFTD